MTLRTEVKEHLAKIRKSTVEACDLCNDGYLPSEIPGELNPCKCMRVFLYLIELVKSKIPMEYWYLTLDELQVNEEYRAFVKFYLERLDKALDRAMGVIFFGANGIGKTSLMCEIGKEVVAHGRRAQYFTVQQYIDAAKGESPILREYNDTDMILLDEMDKVYIKKGSSYVGKVLEDFLRRSRSSGKTIVACTNYDMEAFSRTFGDSTVSMLKRHSKFLEVEGDDYSDSLHDSWKDLLDEDYDFYCPAIVEKAERLHNHVENADREAWK